MEGETEAAQEGFRSEHNSNAVIIQPSALEANRYTRIKIADQHVPWARAGSKMHYGNHHARKGRSPVLLRGCNPASCWPRLEARGRRFVCTSLGEGRRANAIMFAIFDERGFSVR